MNPVDSFISSVPTDTNSSKRIQWPLVILPTYNEVDNINNFLQSIEELNLELDLLLIDDNSPDKTWKLIQEYSKNKKNETNYKSRHKNRYIYFKMGE